VCEFGASLAEVERLGHPPTTWRAAGRLAAALVATGDDEGAGRAYARPAATLDAFTAELSEEHRLRFLAAPQVGEALSVGC
jgi:hypothetical protein